MCNILPHIVKLQAPRSCVCACLSFLCVCVFGFVCVFLGRWLFCVCVSVCDVLDCYPAGSVGVFSINTTLSYEPQGSLSGGQFACMRVCECVLVKVYVCVL